MSDEVDNEEILEISYTPIQGESFGVAEMFAQGASVLDLAAIFALENKDVDQLLRVAKGWTKLAATVASIEELPEEKKNIQKFGFGKENEEEEEIGETNGKSNGKDNIQSKGRLRSYRIRSSGPSTRC